MKFKFSPPNRYYESLQSYNHGNCDAPSLLEANAELALLSQELDNAYAHLFNYFAKFVEYCDTSAGKHPERVAILSARIALRLDMPSDFVDDISKAARLHDIGKIGIPQSIIFKSIHLTDNERRVLQDHCKIGADLLSGSEYPLLNMAEQIAIAHHEKIDGSGYPYNLRKDEIPLAAKIVAVANTYDKLSQKQGFQKQTLEEKDAIDMLVSKKGIHFDIEVIDALVAIKSKTNSEINN